ncbi:MAG: 6-phosphofructokinase [Oliverpabstia sp.]|nr:6-phosphofructokinase [Eubacterium sp.]MDY2594987.1 6-phosphofructokinase [Oliverpabstia sp.]
MKNLLVAQSGGPTAAINATVAGVITEALTSGQVDGIWGAVNGIKGVLEERFVDLREKIQGTGDLDLLCQTPAAALGSCRFKLKDPAVDDSQFSRIVEIFRKHDIKYFIYAGGNDSMDTVDKLSAYCREKGMDDIHVIGAPKTIDNDLVGTDHCPGFGSAAKYIGVTFAELERDCHVYDTKAVTIVEVMGRNAGWLTAASALARNNGGKGPNLIYLCEPAFSIEGFLEDVKRELETNDSVLVAISEGIKDKNGVYISESVQSGAVDTFGHSYIAGSACVLEEAVRSRIGCKVRSIELNLMQRCAAHVASRTDIQESRMLGMTACHLALERKTGLMAAVERISDEPYQVRFTGIPVCSVANQEKKVPEDYINAAGNDVTEKMMSYLRPLIQGEAPVIYKNGIPAHLILY